MTYRSGALALLLAAACTGNIGSHGKGPAGHDPIDNDPGRAGGAPTGGAGGASGATGACGAAGVRKTRTWRLTSTQFRNTAVAVFGFAGPTTDQLPGEGQPDGFSNQADRLSVSPLLATKYLAATDEIAASVVARSAQFLGCPLTSLGMGTCLRDFLTTVGTRAWRRPLTPTEVSKYTDLFTKVSGSSGAEAAFKGVVQALLLSPNFMFRTELGGGGAPGTMTSLTDHELASSLSYMLWDGPPDPMLMQLAASGKLHDPATLVAQAKRLLASAPQASGPLGGFFRQWLQYDALPELSKDTTVFPSFTPEVVADLLAGNRALLDGALLDPAGGRSFKELLTASYGYVTSRTAPLYGVQATGTTPVKTPLPAGQRRGLLTDAAFIAAISDPDDTNLPSRGRIVREQLLCETVPPPAENFKFDDAKITPDMTNREKFLTHTTNPACASCHNVFDGIGFALEQYDAIGRFRTMDKMKTIDPTGTLPVAGETLTFSNYVDLVDQLTKRPETYRCAALQYAAYATGRAAQSIGACESDAIAKAFAAGDYGLEALVSAVVSSPNFIARQN
jgi:hypothetical protein